MTSLFHSWTSVLGNKESPSARLLTVLYANQVRGILPQLHVPDQLRYRTIHYSSFRILFSWRICDLFRFYAVMHDALSLQGSTYFSGVYESPFRFLPFSLLFLSSTFPSVILLHFIVRSLKHNQCPQ